MGTDASALFQEIQSQHLGIIWKTTHAFALTKEDRDDLFQEILIALWEAVPHFEARAKLSTYVYRVAHRRALNWKRSQRRYTGRITAYEQQPTAADTARGDGLAAERIESLYRAINQLAPVERTLCLLYLDHLSYRDIADVLGISEDNVGIRIHRCKEKLSALFKKHHE